MVRSGWAVFMPDLLADRPTAEPANVYPGANWVSTRSAGGSADGPDRALQAKGHGVRSNPRALAARPTRKPGHPLSPLELTCVGDPLDVSRHAVLAMQEGRCRAGELEAEGELRV